jgi:hypothetical protein
MSSLSKISGVILAATALVLMAGCETGRTHKQHHPLSAISDETTTGKQDAAFPSDPAGQPPVPGSPTAAGPDGKQPYDDMQARAGQGAEEGMAPPPAKPIKDSFERQ